MITIKDFLKLGFFNSQKITDEKLNYLASAIENDISNYKSIIISGLDYTSALIQKFKDPELEYKINDVQLNYLQLLFESYPNITNLEISYNFTSENIKPFKSILESNILERLEIFNSNFSEDALPQVNLGLLNNTIENLSIVNSNVDDEFAVSLSLVVGTLKNLKILDLSLNKITEVGATYINSEIHKANLPIQSINYYSNFLTDYCIDDLCEIISKCLTLKELDLSENRLTTAGVSKLYEYFLNKEGEFKINLNNNIITNFYLLSKK